MDPSKTCRPVTLKSTRALRTTSDKGPKFEALEAFTDVEDVVMCETMSSDSEKDTPSKRTRKRRRHEPCKKIRSTPTPKPIYDDDDDDDVDDDDDDDDDGNDDEGEEEPDADLVPSDDDGPVAVG